ncbi:sigma-54-dependent Fis family transcriptional regulator [Fusobacterium sp. IOR10]|uniref:sigma-54 interaction domain-containing protein n=1 Tax=Fusobacterium sp. IOR10 TaxID=2665157 RepID=UPI0013D38CCE|nr:sigma 54-interacting transcriptional regulator [Fusobacterium sp. IOR10]
MELLSNAINDIKKYAETISQVINIDIEIMSKDLVRIAATGILKNKVGLNMSSEAHVYKMVLKTGETKIITSPRKDPICKTCPSKDNCSEKLEISTPIMYKDNPIGVIGLICFKEKQKNDFMEKKDLYIKFLIQMASFISSKIYEANKRKEIEHNNIILSNIIDRIPDSIILTDNNNKIELINKSGKLLFNPEDINHPLKANNIKTLFDKKEFDLITKDNINNVVGDIISFPTNYEESKTLYIFKESNKFMSYINNFKNNFKNNLNDNFTFSSSKMEEVYSKVYKISKTNTTTLLTGESGSGKEIIAKLIHSTSNRSNEKFIAVNCGAIPESLIESEFFGYVKGAFTGANPNGKIGFFEQANNGTIFLDEIGDMPLNLQVKLLRVLQEKIISPIGSNYQKKIDVRIIAATNKNLEKLVENNKFREDLYYRLNVFPIDIPSLKERPKDIKDLTIFFMKKYCQSSSIPEKNISKEVMDVFLKYNWPGNIRELKNVVEYSLAMSDSFNYNVTTKDLPPKLINSLEKNYAKTLADIEKDAILNLLGKYGNSSENKKEIANILGIGIATLYRKIKQYNL